MWGWGRRGGIIHNGRDKSMVVLSNIGAAGEVRKPAPLLGLVFQHEIV